MGNQLDLRLMAIRLKLLRRYQVNSDPQPILTQEEFAIGLSMHGRPLAADDVERFERGDLIPTATDLFAYSKFTGVPVDWILGLARIPTELQREAYEGLHSTEDAYRFLRPA